MVSRELTRDPLTASGLRLGPEAQLALDAAVGTLGAAVGAAVLAARAGARVAAPVARVLWRPPLVPASLHPASVVRAAARAGRVERQVLARRLVLVLDVWTPAVVETLVERIDLTGLVARHVDLDALVAAVDLDAAVARVDLDGAVARVDLDGAVARVDVDAVVRRVAIDAILERIDIDAIVAGVDLDAIIDRIDLDDIATRLDVDAVVARVDFDAIIDRLDLPAIVGEVLDEIDLPAIIRDSTGSMASETVRGVRMTGISADDAISRAVDRALFRRRRRPTPGGSPS